MVRLVIFLSKERLKDNVEHGASKSWLSIGLQKQKKKAPSIRSEYQFDASVNAGQDESQPSVGFSQEQYIKIPYLIQQSMTTPKANFISNSPFVLNSHSPNENDKNPHLWILDTSEIDHISQDIKSFTYCKTIIPGHVSLVDIFQAIAYMSRSVSISHVLTLHNVLYIPCFHVNLLSIAKLVNNNDCHVNFKAYNSNAQTSFNIWHLRLRHISNIDL